METSNTWTVLVITMLGNYKIMFHLVIWQHKQIWHNGKLWICGDGKMKVQCMRDFFEGIVFMMSIFVLSLFYGQLMDRKNLTAQKNIEFNCYLFELR